MLHRPPTRIGDHSVYKKLVKQITQSQLTDIRVNKEMDRCVGKNSQHIRWKLMKRKYTLQSGNCSRRNSGLELDPELVMRIQVREREKNSRSTSLASIIKKPSRKTSKKNLNTQDVEFFSGDKKSLHYLQKTSKVYNKLKTEQTERRRKENQQSSWYECLEKKAVAKKWRKIEHPVMDLYKEAMDDVILNRSKMEFKKPFEWFVSPFELDDF